MNTKPKKVRVNDTRGFFHPVTAKHAYVTFDQELTLAQVATKFSSEIRRYEVRDGDELIGYVFSFKSSSYRYAGNLIARTFNPTRWRHAIKGSFFDSRGERDRRVDALADLLEERHIKSLTPDTRAG